MRECLDEGILQSYFDGELSSERMETVTAHLVSCLNCATAARQLESEVLMLSSALAHEFDAVVPTERLRHRIDAAVADLRLENQGAVREPVSVAGHSWIQSITALFALTPQRTFGYAALALMLALGAIIGVFQLRQVPSNQDNVAKVVPSPAPVIKTTTTGGDALSPDVPTTVAKAPVVVIDRGERTRPVRRPTTVSNQAVAQVKLLPGERSYLKTIAALDSTIKSKSNRPMRPSLRAEYERNLAVVDRALAATRNAAKKNPNDPDAAEFMFNAYQSKVDLLNTVADARLYNRP